MEKTVIEPMLVYVTRLVKSEDLNHHGTLFAGRTAEWFVEAGFIAATKLVDPKCIVCLKIHGMFFTKPVRPGQILKFEAKVVYTGKSSMVSHIEVIQDKTNESIVSGFITFIHVDETTKATEHFIEIAPKTEVDKQLYEKAKNLRKK